MRGLGAINISLLAERSKAGGFPHIRRQSQDRVVQPSQQAGSEYQRDVREVLAEILELVRDQSRENKSFLPALESRSIVRGKALSPGVKRLLAEHFGWPLEKVEDGLFSPGFLHDIVLRSRNRPVDGAREATLAEIEANYISKILAATKGNKTEAAQILGISRKSLYERIARRSDLAAQVMADLEEEASDEDKPKDNLDL